MKSGTVSYQVDGGIGTTTSLALFKGAFGAHR